MITAHPSEGIGVLRAPFVRQRRTLQEIRRAHGEARTTEEIDAYRQAELIVRERLFERIRLLAELVLEVAPILEARFVVEIRAQDGIKARNAPIFLHKIVAETGRTEGVRRLRLNPGW